MSDDKQGVISMIEFPTNQDQVAVSLAIRSLLREGWVFDGIRRDQLRLRRVWDVTVEDVRAGITDTP